MTAASTTSRLDDLRGRIAALQTRFAEVGARAARAAADVRAGGAPPPPELPPPPAPRPPGVPAPPGRLLREAAAVDGGVVPTPRPPRTPPRAAAILRAPATTR